MRRVRLLLAWLAMALLAACAAGERVPDWRVRAVGHVERATTAWLEGETRVAEREFALARAQAARTGRPELVARVELNRCALQVASLDFQPCGGFEALRGDADAAERAYADYLYRTVDASASALLPPQHQAIAAGGNALADIADPVARLVAAGVLLRSERIGLPEVVLATDTASDQGWRRPLLAWLGTQARLAELRGDPDEVARLRRRMDLVQPARRP